MVDEAILAIAKNFLKQIPAELGVTKSFLFGSYARGNEREESDIDIAMVVANMPDFFYTHTKLRKIRRKIDLRIKPHPIRELNFNQLNPFASEIEQTGIEIRI